MGCFGFFFQVLGFSFWGFWWVSDLVLLGFFLGFFLLFFFFVLALAARVYPPVYLGSPYAFLINYLLIKKKNSERTKFSSKLD